MKKKLIFIALVCIATVMQHSSAGEFNPLQYKQDCEAVGVKPWISSLKEFQKRKDQIMAKARLNGLTSSRDVYSALYRIENIIKHIDISKKSEKYPYKRTSKVLRYGLFTKDLEVQEGYNYSYLDSSDRGFSLIRSYNYSGWRYERLCGIACLCAIPAYYYRSDLVSLFNVYASPLLSKLGLK